MGDERLERYLDRIVDDKDVAKRCRKYRIDVAEYARLLRRQAGRCGVCEVSCWDRQLHIDHDHETGRVRGLLCAACNTGAGQMGVDGAQAVTRALRLLMYMRAAGSSPIGTLVASRAGSDMEAVIAEAREAVDLLEAIAAAGRRSGRQVMPPGAAERAAKAAIGLQGLVLQAVA